MPVGGIAVALMLGTSVLLSVPVDGPLLVTAFCGTSLVYLADRSLGAAPEDRINHPGRVEWVRRHRGWLWGETGGLVVGAASMVPLLQRETTIAAFALAGIGVVHVLPVLPGGRRLKSAGRVKPLVVAFTWAVGAVVLPVLEAGSDLTLSVLGITTYRFLMVLPNVLLADWADREGDAAAGVGIGAARWSRRAVLWRSTLVLAIGVGGAGAAVGLFGAPPLLLVDAVGGVLLGGALWRSRPDLSPLHLRLLDLVVGWPVVVWGTAALGLL